MSKVWRRRLLLGWWAVLPTCIVVGVLTAILFGADEAKKECRYVIDAYWHGIDHS